MFVCVDVSVGLCVCVLRHMFVFSHMLSNSSVHELGVFECVCVSVYVCEITCVVCVNVLIFVLMPVCVRCVCVYVLYVGHIYLHPTVSVYPIFNRA